MTISITINAQDVPSLQRMCAELAHSGAPAEAIAAVTTDGSAADIAVQVANAKAANKQGRKSSKAAEAPKEPDAASSAEAKVVSPPTASADTLSIDNLRDKLRELSAAKGLPAVTEILKGFGVNRVSDAKAAEYAAIIAKVDAALKG